MEDPELKKYAVGSEQYYKVLRAKLGMAPLNGK